jgi:hypothetical protein
MYPGVALAIRIIFQKATVETWNSAVVDTSWMDPFQQWSWEYVCNMQLNLVRYASLTG